jgi:hypothetical protein
MLKVLCLVVFSQANLMALGPLFAALSLRDDFVFFGEGVGSVTKGGFALLQDTGARLAAKGEIPVFGELLGLGSPSSFVVFRNCWPSTEAAQCQTSPRRYSWRSICASRVLAFLRKGPVR